MSPKQHLKKSYGFDFPEDFFQFYEFAQRLKVHPELEVSYEKGLGLLGML